MLSNAIIPLLLAGLASAIPQDDSAASITTPATPVATPSGTAATTTNSAAASGNVVSFALLGETDNHYVPTAGVTGSLLGVTSGRTTLAYTCPSSDFLAGTPGAGCPSLSNVPMTITYGAGFLGQSVSTTVSSIGVSIDLECAITAAPAPAATTTSASVGGDPVCVMTLGGDYADELAAVYKCSNPESTSSFWDCVSQATATPTNVVTSTFDASDVLYWTVTVTGTAKGAVATAGSKSSDAAALGLGVRAWAVGVVGLVAGVLAL